MRLEAVKALSGCPGWNSSGSEGDQAVAYAERHRFRAGGRSQLAEDRGDVELDRVAGNPEASGDPAIAHTLRHHLENLQLSRGEPCPLAHLPRSRRRDGTGDHGGTV